MIILLALLGCRSEDADYGLIDKLAVDQAIIKQNIDKVCAALDMEDARRHLARGP